MRIKPSPTSEIRSLIESLGGGDEIKREAAIARLAVIGRRAVDRLSAVYVDPSTNRDKRIAILRVLEAAADPRGVSIARAGLREGGDVAVAAASALRGVLDVPDADTSAAALDGLVAAALDRGAERRVRLAAFEALQGLKGEVHARVASALAEDLGTLAKQPQPSKLRMSATDAVWQDATEGRIPDDPAALQSAVRARGSSAALSSLQKLVDAAKAREHEAGPGTRAQQWHALRGALHQALALRGSTVAVYDLRETFAAAEAPLSTPYVAALQTIGDDSCLEAIAAAYSRAGADERWRHQLTTAFEAIVKRERTARDGRAMKRIAARWPEASAALSKTWRTTPRPRTARRT